MGVRNVVPIHDIVKPDIFEDKIELISTCEMSIDELKAFALVLKYAAVVMEKDGITKESIKNGRLSCMNTSRREMHPIHGNS